MRVTSPDGHDLGRVEHVPADPNGGWHPFTVESWLAYQPWDEDGEAALRFDTRQQAERYLHTRAGYR